MTAIPRRDAVGLMAIAALQLTKPDMARVQELVRTARREAEARVQAFEPKFFTAHEYDTVRLLADLIIPRDERSGSASDAGVPEFMDFVMLEYPNNQTWMRGGLAWMDNECRERFSQDFLASTDAQRTTLLDLIAWPKRARPEVSHGVAFFNNFRDMTASGFFSSQPGVQDLRYMGNTFVTEWQGCPAEVLAKIGVHYD